MDEYPARTAKLPPDAGEEIRIGVSACLLGDEVRFDGGHRRNDFMIRILGPFVRCLPVRPELEAGLGGRPRSVPAALLRELARLHRVESLRGQTYLDPHPGR